MTQTFFADTSFLVAFHNVRDDHHKQARGFIGKLSERKEAARFLITDYIFDETLTTILNRGGKRLAIEAAEKIFSSPAISIMTIDADIFSQAYNLFIHYADQEWSFIDCSSIAFPRAHFAARPISVATFDRHFVAAGFQTVPVV
ncbi:MAG: type II toxin-antitoxin system VapC family toxin [Nitrospinae bacterium]|nr:type II toxin-antitoxin system VapC family toxin [Nitrospinota bacterium]